MYVHRNVTHLAAGSGEAAHLAVLHSGPADPVDARVAADNRVGRIHQDDLPTRLVRKLCAAKIIMRALFARVAFHLEVLVHAVRRHPVGVKDAQVAAALANTLLSNRAQVAAELKLVDTLSLGLTIDDTLVHGPLPVAAPDTDAEDDEALLGLIPEPAGETLHR